MTRVVSFPSSKRIFAELGRGGRWQDARHESTRWLPKQKNSLLCPDNTTLKFAISTANGLTQNIEFNLSVIGASLQVLLDKLVGHEGKTFSCQYLVTQLTDVIFASVITINSAHDTLANYLKEQLTQQLLKRIEMDIAVKQASEDFKIKQAQLAVELFSLSEELVILEGENDDGCNNTDIENHETQIENKEQQQHHNQLSLDACTEYLSSLTRQRLYEDIALAFACASCKIGLPEEYKAEVVSNMWDALTAVANTRLVSAKAGVMPGSFSLLGGRVSFFLPPDDLILKLQARLPRLLKVKKYNVLNSNIRKVEQYLKDKQDLVSPSHLKLAEAIKLKLHERLQTLIAQHKKASASRFVSRHMRNWQPVDDYEPPVICPVEAEDIANGDLGSGGEIAALLDELHTIMTPAF